LFVCTAVRTILSDEDVAAAYQVEFSRYHPRVTPRVTTLLEDYTCFVVPNAPRSVLLGHTANVKAIEFVGEARLLSTCLPPVFACCLVRVLLYDGV
jgi:hypothetical protein